MCVDILIVEIAGSGVMKITVYSVTSYAFRKDFFWGGGGCANHVSVKLVVYFYIYDITILENIYFVKS